jgi:Helicase HerA, central domain
MKQIEIGNRIEDGKESGAIHLNINGLIRTKALIQGNSGAGKSGLIRVIVEQVAARIPTIIFDPESEFASLREKLDMVLVGYQGELEADVRSAGLLARKLAEMGASAILDIYELKGEQRHQFVKAYLEAQIDLPRKLWRPTLVVIDEAQLFAPEKGFGESLALEAVMDWMFRQRKHGIGSILATPRLSMLNKNVAGANNIFIGRTQLDTDQSRAGKALGMNAKEALGLRDLKGRQFFCYGPALNVKGVTLFRVRDCETTIPEPGVHKHLAPPKASHVVAQLADKLKNIQQEAEAEIRTLDDAKAEVTRLKRELRAAKSGAAPRDQDTKRIAELEATLRTAKEQTKTETKIKEVPALKDSQITRFEKRLDQVEKLVNSLVDLAGKVADLSLLDELKQLRSVLAELKAPIQPVAPAPRPIAPRAVTLASRPTSSLVTPPSANGNGHLGDGGLSKGPLKLLRSIVQFGRVTRDQLTLLSGYTQSSRDTYLKQLSSQGLVIYPNRGEVEATETGREAAGEVEMPPTGEALIDWWLQRLPSGHAKVFEAVVSERGAAVSRARITELTGYTQSSRDTYIKKLKTRKLITLPSPGMVAPAEFLFQ